MIKKFSIFLLIAVGCSMFLSACGSNNNGSSQSYLGQPVSFAVVHPNLVPVVSCPDGSSGIIICHFPPGNPSNQQTLCIGEPAVQAHVSHHGDYLGACVPPPTPTPIPFGG